MDIGVWMSRGVLAHKREDDVAVQVWNLRRIPDGLVESADGGRLFVSVDEHWRGFFRLSGPVMTNPADADCPYTLTFDPQSWTAMLARPSPPLDRRACYTLELPEVVPASSGRTIPKNEIDELKAL